MRARAKIPALGAALITLACTGAPLACGSSAADGNDGRPPVSLGEGGPDAHGSDGDKPTVDGGFAGPDGGVLRADRFVTRVVSFTPGDCAGFGATSMPDVVKGPPVGGGAGAGGLDVVSLGEKGEIVLSFEPNAIVDGPGADFIVFENPFVDNGVPNAEPGEVSVSGDGVTWRPFPCTDGPGPTYGTCAGWRPVYSAPGNGISPVDPATAGGDPFDLADLGLASARYVRIRDIGTVKCPANPAQKSTTAGFDLDAISIVNAKIP